MLFIALFLIEGTLKCLMFSVCGVRVCIVVHPQTISRLKHSFELQSRATQRLAFALHLVNFLSREIDLENLFKAV